MADTDSQPTTQPKASQPGASNQAKPSLSTTRKGGGVQAKIFGFVVLVLGFTMLIAGVSGSGFLGMPQRIALGLFGVFGCYWGLRFLRLGRQQNDDQIRL